MSLLNTSTGCLMAAHVVYFMQHLESFFLSPRFSYEGWPSRSSAKDARPQAAETSGAQVVQVRRGPMVIKSWLLKMISES